MPAQEPFQQALGRLGVAAGLDNLIEHVTILIHGPPEPVLLAGDRDHDLVEVPDVAAAWRLAPETASVRGPELQRPPADHLVGTTMPRSSSISSISRRLRGNRKYNHTAWVLSQHFVSEFQLR
jgi:hypothetical protein